ncbi:MAG: signal peptidase I [Elusimicrobiota bacterium]|jgi:signal peptidase I|nr:signal peptidase I [Elusimicrobiota bacterium]
MEFKLFIIGVGFLAVAIVMQIVRKIKYCQAEPPLLWAKIYSFVDTAWTALLIAAVIMYLFIQAFKIPSGSMRNTLLEGDHLFVNKFIYGFHIPFTDRKRFFPIRQIRRGDIVVFEAPQSALSQEEKAANLNKDFIKRCVAIAGDTVEIRNKKLFVNGIAQNEPYVIYGDPNYYAGISNNAADYQGYWEDGLFTLMPVRDNMGPVTIPQGHYMMMGDNRDYSFDSRFFGPVPDRLIKGKALFLYWPLSRIRIVK